ncbi:MAG: HD domain-containing protein [Opitutaceae bacterium]|nr:HD domain-containing protein [Cephaloticoccus sp.]MCP5528936.1 HD domain-containing protein [Opitutaceae bacterium]
MKLPPDLMAVLEAVRRVGRPRLVGGGVRDWLLGLESHDYDVEVAGVDFETLQRALAPFGATDVVGRSFGVIKLRNRGREYDFSLPRRESKTGAGHRGFMVQPDPDLSDAEAAARRDFTVNAIAYDPFADQLIDPHDGQSDLRQRLLRHTSAAFSDDPLRVLRGFQLAARFDFALAPETAALCRRISPSYHELPKERVWGEWEKWAVKSTKPSRGLDVLTETDWLRHFPEIAVLAETPQDPEWHPEGNVFVHTQLCLDALVKLAGWAQSPAVRRLQLSLAVLAHDFGKPATTVRGERKGQERIISPGHEAVSVEPTLAFLRRIGAPLELDGLVSPLVMHHLAHHHGQGEFSDAAVRRLARKLAPATIDDLMLVMRADHDGRPPLHSAETLAHIEALGAKAQALALQAAAPQPIVLGRHLIALGHPPGPDFKPILDAAFEAQLDGQFTHELGGIAWLRHYLSVPPLK